MELKKYFDLLRELSKTGQIKWVHRANDAYFTFDYITVDRKHTVSIIWDGTINANRAIITEPHSNPGVNQQITFAIEGLNREGDIYKALTKLWDQILDINLTDHTAKWTKVLPELDVKIKFGPKETKKHP